MIVLVSLIVLLRIVSTIFCMVHPIPTSPFIQLNDFCTCSTYFFRIFFMVHVNVATHMRIIYAYVYTYNIILVG